MLEGLIGMLEVVGPILESLCPVRAYPTGVGYGYEAVLG
jgi:hypothetical protein